MVGVFWVDLCPCAQKCACSDKQEMQQKGGNTRTWHGCKWVCGARHNGTPSLRFGGPGAAQLLNDRRWDTTVGFTIVVAADSAGVEYKEILKRDLEADPRVDTVIDVGLSAGQDIDYPHVAVAGARLIAEAKPTAACSSAAPVWVSPWQPTRCPESAPPSRTIPSPLSA